MHNVWSCSTVTTFVNIAAEEGENKEEERATYLVHVRLIDALNTKKGTDVK